MMRFGILGSVELYEDGHAVPIGGRRQVALLGYLLINANRPAPPDRLIDAVWGGRRSDATLKSMQVAVARLRKTLAGARADAGRDAGLHTVPSGYLLEVRPGQCDADVAGERIAAGRHALADGDASGAATALRAALELWRGPVLADLAYEDFAQGEINRLEELRLCALDLRIEAELRLGQHAALLPELEALAVVHPDDERITRHLMLALYRCGRQGEAVEVYRSFARACIDNGLEPGPRLQQLQADILSHAASLQWRGEQSPTAQAAAPPRPQRGRSAPRRVPESAFVGRRAVLERLHSHWERCRSGLTGHILVEGEPGVGKTRLVLHFADEVRRSGAVALYGRAEQEALRPFQPFAEALEQLLDVAGPEFERRLEPELAALDQLTPDVRSGRQAVSQPSQNRFELFQALVTVLAEASRTSPVLLVLDDLQWADKPTLLLVRHVLRYAHGCPLLIAGTCRTAGHSWQPRLDRDHEFPAWRAELHREQLLDNVVELGGLDREETRRLLADQLGVAVTPDAVRRLHDRTAGNAFFIEETVRALGNSGVELDTVVDSATLERVGVPPSVREAILERRRRLSALAARLLDAAAVMGRPVELDARPAASVDLETLARLLDTSLSMVVTAAEELEDAGLLDEVSGRGDVLTFSHDVVREVVYRSLLAARRLVLHYDLGCTLEALRKDADPAELAYHFHRACQLAGSPPPAKYAELARKYKIRAGRRAEELYAYEEAARHFVDALELSSPDDHAGRCDVLLGLGRVRSLAGGTLDADRLWQVPARARDAYRDAFRCAERSGNVEQLAEAALGVGERYFEMTYSDSNHLDLLETALDTAPSDATRALLLARLASNRAFPHENEAAGRRAKQAVEMARALGNEHLLFAVLLARHVTLLDVAHLDERLEISDELGSLVPARQEFAAEYRHWRMYDLLELGDTEGARQEHAQLEEIAGRLGQPLYRSIAAAGRGLFAELDGDLTEAERCSEEFRRFAASARTLDAKSAWAAQVFRRRLLAGDAEPLRALAEDLEQLVAGGGHKLGWRCGLGVLRDELGDTEAARRLFDEERGRLPRGMFRLVHSAMLSELAARLGETERAKALYEDLLPHRRRNVVVAYCGFWGPVEAVLGQLAATFGDSAAAKEHLELALERAREMRAPLLTQELEGRLELCHAGAPARA